MLLIDWPRSAGNSVISSRHFNTHTHTHKLLFSFSLTNTCTSTCTHTLVYTLCIYIYNTSSLLLTLSLSHTQADMHAHTRRHTHCDRLLTSVVSYFVDPHWSWVQLIPKALHEWVHVYPKGFKEIEMLFSGLHIWKDSPDWYILYTLKFNYVRDRKTTSIFLRINSQHYHGSSLRHRRGLPTLGKNMPTR